MLDFRQQARRSAVLLAVQQQIFCAQTKEALDIDDSVLLTNLDTGAMSILTTAATDDLRPKLIEFAKKSTTRFELWIGKTGEEELIG